MSVGDSKAIIMWHNSVDYRTFHCELVTLGYNFEDALKGN